MLPRCKSGDGILITPVDIEQRIGSFPSNYVRKLTRSTDNQQPADANTGREELQIKDIDLATLSFGELLEIAADLQLKVKEQEENKLEIEEMMEIAKQERIIAVRRHGHRLSTGCSLLCATDSGLAI